MCRPWVRQRSRAHAASLHGRSAPRGPPAVPERRLWPLAARGHVGIPRPPGYPGQDQWLRDTEHRLAAAWAEVLGIPKDQIGRRDHFFDLGGTSLSVLKLAITLDRAVSLKDLTGHPILADLATLIDGRSEQRLRAAPITLASP